MSIDAENGIIDAQKGIADAQKGIAYYQNIKKGIDAKTITPGLSYGMISAVIPKESLYRLSKAKTGDVQEIAAAQMEILSTYYNVGIEQSNRSFISASIAAGIGLVFFIIIIAYSIWKPQENVVSVASLGTALSGFISGICFYLYNKSTSQLSSFHEKLYMTQRYLLANSMCEGLEGSSKAETRSAIIKQLANVPPIQSSFSEPPQPNSDPN